MLTNVKRIGYIPNTMKKIITIFAMSAALLSLTIVNTGCEAIKGWFHSDNFTTVAGVIAPSIKTASQFTVNAVCKKNPDLTNIFIASANGIKIATNAGTYSTEEIEAYIKSAMGKEADTWYPLVKSSMDVMLSWYDAIYKKYFNKEDDKCLQGFNDILNSLADGVILGANMSKGTVTGLAGAIADKNYEAVAVADLKAKCARYGIEIK